MIYIGNDHAGFELKSKIYSYIKDELNKDIVDLGCFSKESIDYSDIAKLVCDKVKKDNCLGILICGTGIGMSISANKINGIRCAVCSDEYSAKMSIEHNNANILALGSRVIGLELAKSITGSFLNSVFQAGKHDRRVDKIMDLEK